MNIKIIDQNSGFMYTELIPDKTAKTTANFVEKFIARSERQTGKKIKPIMTDSGTEFQGEFFNLLEEHGIIKKKWQGYDHHLPGKIENAHRIINGMVRSMLAESKLPTYLYGEAILFATYTLKRFQQNNQKSRYEKFFNKKPKTNHLHPFGQSITHLFRMKNVANWIQ